MTVEDRAAVFDEIRAQLAIKLEREPTIAEVYEVYKTLAKATGAD